MAKCKVYKIIDGKTVQYTGRDGAEEDYSSVSGEDESFVAKKFYQDCLDLADSFLLFAFTRRGDTFELIDQIELDATWLREDVLTIDEAIAQVVEKEIGDTQDITEVLSLDVTETWDDQFNLFDDYVIVFGIARHESINWSETLTRTFFRSFEDTFGFSGTLILDHGGYGDFGYGEGGYGGEQQIEA